MVCSGGRGGGGCGLVDGGEGNTNSEAGSGEVKIYRARGRQGVRNSITSRAASTRSHTKVR